MIIRFFLFCCILFGSASCQHYIIRSKYDGKVDELKGVNYKIVSVVEKESDPRFIDTKVAFEELPDKRRIDFDKVFSNEIEKNFGKSDKSADEILVQAKINRKVRCESSLNISFNSGMSISNDYRQHGSILFNLSGVSKKNNNKIFDVNVEYDMSSKGTGAKIFTCDSYSKVTKIINEKILPLAVKEIGQNRVIDK